MARRITQAGALVLWMCAGMAGAGRADPAVPATQPYVEYMIVITGGEILAGAYPDAHTCFIARTLHPLGLHCVGSITVDDVPADMKDALAYALRRAKLVIVTGGLGPTENDVTRQTLAEFTGIELREHPEVVRDMEKRLGVPREKMRPNLRRQTMVPVRGGYLRAEGGTAAGLVFDTDQAVIVALPGPPRELQPMVRNELVPYLARRFGTRGKACTVMLRFVGLGQSQISQTLHDNGLLPPDVIVGSQFDALRVDYTFSLPVDTPENRARLAAVKAAIMKHFGQSIYADDETSLEEHVGRLLRERGGTLALAEVAGGGVVAAGLHGSAAARAVLAGAWTAPTEEGLRRLLIVDDNQWTEAATPERRAELLIASAAARSGADWVIVVGEADGARSAAAALRLADGTVKHARFIVRGEGEQARGILATQVLDWVRRALKG